VRIRAAFRFVTSRRPVSTEEGARGDGWLALGVPTWRTLHLPEGARWCVQLQDDLDGPLPRGSSRRQSFRVSLLSRRHRALPREGPAAVGRLKISSRARAARKSRTRGTDARKVFLLLAVLFV